MTYDELKKYFDIDVNKVNKFLTFLFEENKKYNLTSITDLGDAIKKHIYDSLLISKVYNFENKLILDVGSGGGFPGIPLAILFPNSHFVLLDSTGKKIEFLNSVIKLLELKNVSTINARVEQVKQNEKYDVIISRAFSQLNIYLELVTYLTKINGNIIALKGKNANEELENSKNAIKKLDLELVKTQEENLPLSDEKRINFIFKKLKATNKKYPRNYGDILKKPL